VGVIAVLSRPNPSEATGVNARTSDASRKAQAMKALDDYPVPRPEGPPDRHFRPAFRRQGRERLSPCIGLATFFGREALSCFGVRAVRRRFRR
jgi:hypothetical protein